MWFLASVTSLVLLATSSSTFLSIYMRICCYCVAKSSLRSVPFLNSLTFSSSSCCCTLFCISRCSLNLLAISYSTYLRLSDISCLMRLFSCVACSLLAFSSTIYSFKNYSCMSMSIRPLLEPPSWFGSPKA